MTQKSDSGAAGGFPAFLTAWMAGRTRAEVAPVLGVSWGTVDNWLAGASRPPRTRLPFIASAMGVTLEVLTKALAESTAAPASPSARVEDADCVGVGACAQPAGQVTP